MQKRILVFGDSIAYGSWDSNGGWVDRLKELAHTETLNQNGQHKFQVLNLAVPGDTSTRILEKVDREVAVRANPEWELQFIFAFGGNDSREINHSSETPLNIFLENSRKIIDITSKYPTIFLGPTPLADMDLTLNNHRYTDRKIQEYDAHLKQLVEEQGTTYVSTRPLFEKLDREQLFSFDRLHPNDNGHAIILRGLLPKLESVFGFKMLPSPD